MAKYIYYRYHEYPELENNNNMAIALYKSQIKEFVETRIRVIEDTCGISVYEDETDSLIQTRTDEKYHFELREAVVQEYLKGSRFSERYSYFKIRVTNFNGSNKNIKVNVSLSDGEKYNESIIRNNGWGNSELYVSYIISGIKQKCREHKLANLNFEIIDLEYNLNTSCHTSFYASQYFIDEFVKPKLKRKASA